MEQDMKNFVLGQAMNPIELFSHLTAEQQKHSRFVAKLTMKLLQCAYDRGHLGQNSEYSIAEIEDAVLYHDIGFTLIPERLQNKMEAFTDAEIRVVRQHTIYGAKILERWQEEEQFQEKKKIWQLAAEIALSHHERWNGKGYPYGLRTTGITHISRIAAIADTYDSIIRGAPYRMALPAEFALVELSMGAGKDFDPGYVDIFIKCSNEISKLSTKERV